jgi:hypothetical protein
VSDFEREATSVVEELLREHQKRMLDQQAGGRLVDAEPSDTKIAFNGPLPLIQVEAPIAPWQPIRFTFATLSTSARSATAYVAALDALPLLESPRYQPGKGTTFCNIFVWDATRLLGCEIPHWVDLDGNSCAMGKGREQTANDMVDWLSENGQRHGWGPCGPATAQLLASRGNPAVAVWKNPDGVGHVAMVRPGELHPEKGPHIAQAGKTNFRHGHVLDGFGSGRAVDYYVHLLVERKDGAP